ncbi:SDR family oxidoreductase [Francisellaceae bacterium]|nr:SDR family oxidoreductase [Francisellaceae bacterium]
MQNLANQHVMIFGASSGMGREIALACINQNMNVSMCARRTEKLSEMAAWNQQSIFYDQVDIRDKLNVDNFVNNAVNNYGQPDYVINCVGVMYYQLMQKKDYNQWLKMINTNVIGFLNITHAIIDPITYSRGIFINITSDAGRKAFPGLSVYSGTKAFMEFTLSGLRQELIASGVRVVNIQPGNVKTPLQGMSTDKEAEQLYGSFAYQEFLNPIDVANTVIYAMQQPSHVAMNEILIEPQQEPI